MDVSGWTIVVTGGAGFIGSHVCEELLDRDAKVICIDNLSTGSAENIKHFRRDKKFVFLNWDVTKHLFLQGPVDAVMHLASPASPADYLKFPLQTMAAGSQGTREMLELAHEKGARFLLASTSEVYGDPIVHPQPESYWGNVNTIGPRGCYDEAKRFAEALTMAYSRENRMETRIARIFNTYGPRMRRNDGRSIPNFIIQSLEKSPVTIHGSGSQTRSFCFVRDTVLGLIKLMEHDSYVDPVNIGNDRELPISSVAKKIIRMTKSTSKLKFVAAMVDDPKVRRPDLTVARNVLGWEPEFSLEKGLERTIQWFKRRP